ncbi:MAG: hypothetical protein KA171_11695 [Reyranella sp.]|nr:hypothetical protein [Reyranella sp.]
MSTEPAAGQSGRIRSAATRSFAGVRSEVAISSAEAVEDYRDEARVSRYRYH